MDDALRPGYNEIRKSNNQFCCRENLSYRLSFSPEGLSALAIHLQSVLRAVANTARVFITGNTRHPTSSNILDEVRRVGATAGTQCHKHQAGESQLPIVNDASCSINVDAIAANRFEN